MCMIICFGSFVTPIFLRVDTVDRVPSFVVRISRSISATCSRAAVVFTIAMSISGAILVNSWSISMTFTKNPPRVYTLSTFFRLELEKDQCDLGDIQTCTV